MEPDILPSIKILDLEHRQFSEMIESLQHNFIESLSEKIQRLIRRPGRYSPTQLSSLILLFSRTLSSHFEFEENCVWPRLKELDRINIHSGETL